MNHSEIGAEDGKNSWLYRLSTEQPDGSMKTKGNKHKQVGFTTDRTHNRSRSPRSVASGQ